MNVAMNSAYEVFVGHPKYKWPVGRPKRRQVDNITNNKISEVVTHEGKRPRGRHRRRLEDNIKIDLHEMGCGGMDWIEWLRIGTVGGHL
jgi:hypothetical protein